MWTKQPPLESVSIWPTADDDGVDGGAIITADLRINGQPVRLACPHLSCGDFTDDDEEPCGIDAAIEAVTTVTELVNREVGSYLRTSTPQLGGQDQTAHDVTAVLNAAVDDLLEVVDAADEGLRNALNLAVNAAAAYRQHGWRTADRSRLQHVAASAYGEDPDTILGWIGAGIR